MVIKLFVEQSVPAYEKNIKTVHYWPFVRRIHQWLGILITKGWYPVMEPVTGNSHHKGLVPSDLIQYYKET